MMMVVMMMMTLTGDAGDDDDDGGDDDDHDDDDDDAADDGDDFCIPFGLSMVGHVGLYSEIRLKAQQEPVRNSCSSLRKIC